MNDPHLALQKKFEEHFATVDAIAQIVLKGHLLIEEAFDNILGKFVFHPEYLESANLRFAQKIDLARSVSLDDHDNEMWELVKAINGLRNELSHSLKSAKRQQKTQRVIDLYIKLLDNAEMVARHKNESEEVLLMWATSFFLGYLSAFEAEVDRFKSLVNALDHAANPHRHLKKGLPGSDG